MNTDELTISVVLASMVAVIILARKLNIAYPILLLLTGLLIGFVPGAPSLEIDPEIILLGALPPLLFYHSFLTSSREIKRNAGAIVTLSIGLVFVTTAVVAALAHLAFGLPLAASIALGAMVGPTDPVAFLTVARRLGISPRIVGLLDGENLVNDTAAIVLYALAVEYITTDSFDFTSAALLFLAGSAGGVAWGYLVGRAAAAINTHIEDPATAPVIVCSLHIWLSFRPRRPTYQLFWQRSQPGE
jgi:NhaP-type Na+/H+ or K+/H+ antiporter